MYVLDLTKPESMLKSSSSARGVSSSFSAFSDSSELYFEIISFLMNLFLFGFRYL